MIVTPGNPLGASIQGNEIILSGQAIGDMLYADSTTSFTRLPKGTALYLLRTNAGATAPEWVSPSAVSTMTLKGSATVSGASVSSVSISSLDLDADGIYLLIGSIVSDNAGNMNMKIYFNNDTTDANYRACYINSDTATTVDRLSIPIVGELGAAGETLFFHCYIMRDVNGKVKYVSKGIGKEMASCRITDVHGSWTTAANLTSLRIDSAVASKIKDGTKIYLYRMATS